VATLGFEEARRCVLETVRAGRRLTPIAEVPLAESGGLVLAEDILADRDYPPVNKSVRDGYAVRAADAPGSFSVLGEVRAGQQFAGSVGTREAVEIMTGAPLPPGADAVIMVEHTARSNGRMSTDRSMTAGENYSAAGVEARSGEVVVPSGVRLGYAEIAMAAMTGCISVCVRERPRVAILTTGDEIVSVEQAPEPWQVRNSNLFSLSAQVARAGGVSVPLATAPDEYETTRALVEQALEADLLLLSGGVSAGKYDLVERVLADMGAEFFFDRVRIQPGQPLVFGRVKGVFFFGLPGNPVSTMVTFEVFARAALDLIAGMEESGLPLLLARLEDGFHQKPGLTRFLPAKVAPDGAAVTPVNWRGSSDIPALVRANAFLVTEPDRERWDAGELIRVLPR
jgi:molybdopterin molybdotransferase